MSVLSQEELFETKSPRKLNETELSSLRELLKKEASSTEGGDDEDINDLLDYAFAMVGNGKAVGYVVDELISMEMDGCDAEAAKRMGARLAIFLRDMDSNNNNKETVLQDAAVMKEKDGTSDTNEVNSGVTTIKVSAY
uniref:Uncharacterized protein n=1 Tax=Ditylum brightwellii TaxID=49249 RepID=A0A7S2EI89_9STRA|mmetsp:Transcript_30287/g.45042  ORF Transcript_30287/g.45042 Transcript_30287/m.45042 type:complete len:138 (+) Transcript_30287:330-743(+)